MENTILGLGLMTEISDQVLHLTYVMPLHLLTASIDEAWNLAAAKAAKLVSQLTLEEKSYMVTGNSSAGACIGNINAIPRLGLRSFCSQDGPTALNRADLISIFPAGMTAAASWDKDLIYERGHSLGNEFRDKGAHAILGSV